MHVHVHPIILSMQNTCTKCQGHGIGHKTKALSEELRSSEKRECMWSKGKGTQPDTKGSGFKSQSALKLFLL